MLAIAGLVVILLAIVVSTVMDGNSFGPLIGPSSFVLVIFAAFGAAVVSSEIADVTGLPKAIVKALTDKPKDLDGRVATYMELSEVVRREGHLALERHLESIDEPFLKYGLALVMDGADEQRLRNELDAYVTAVEDRHAAAPALLRKLAAYAPAFGMVGTVIGLINMLGNLSDPSQLGSGMALALLTTLYGSMFANIVFQPFAERLEKLHEAEMAVYAFDIDGICALQEGTTPRSLVEHLESLLPPAQRKGYDGRTGKAA